MQKFSWRTMIIFVMVLLLGVVLVGLGTAYVSKLKQQRRQLSDSCPFRATLGGGACAPIRPTYRSSALQSNQSSGGENPKAILCDTSEEIFRRINQPKNRALTNRTA